jgi:hypothetical protein
MRTATIGLIAAAARLVLGPGGNTVYDAVNGVNWLADANLAATNRFGLPLCNGSGNGTRLCVNASGSMNYNAALAWVAAMNAANYLGHSNWQLPTTPTTDTTCPKTGPNGSSFGFGCTAGALDSLYNSLGFIPPNTAVPIPNNTVGPFSKFQPYLYWSQTSAGATQGNTTFSFATGWQGANTLPNFLYLLPMVSGKIPGTPPASGTGLQVNPGGQSVYDPMTNITWAASANLAATNTFGLPPCQSPTTPAICVAQDGAMSWSSALQYLANMNSAAYLGQTQWQAPAIDPSCPGYSCAGNLNPLGNLFYSQLGFSPGMSAVVTPDLAVGPFHNIQPYLYWTCGGAAIQNACSTEGPAPSFEWSYSFGSGFQGTDLLANNLYVMAYYVGPPLTLTCTYTLSGGGQAFSSQGGSGSITITAPPGCPWEVGGLASWVMLTSPSSGTGNGTVTFATSPNSGGDLSGSFNIAGQPFTIEQEAPSIPGLSYIGSMPHIAAQENWTTSFTIVNKSASASTARLSLFGDPSGTLSLPLLFPQVTGTTLPEQAATLDRPLNPNASLIITSAGPQVPPVQIGSAQLSGTGAVDGFAIFHLIPGSQEAVVPMETRNASSYLLAYDNTGGVVLGVAVANVAAQAGTVGIILRDDTGSQIGTGSLPMQSSGHTSFVLSSQFPATANKRGTIEFDTPPGGQISVLGIRTTPLSGSTTLTTIPALANVGTNGGSIAHIATGNGWQTTFVLVNTGTSSAQVNLNFFADVTGAPLSLPLSFPQTGTGSTASSVSQSLAAGASLLVQSAAPASNPAPTIGSAQLTTNGKVGGFVIFRYNPNGQEAVVPLESRTADGFMIAFDNTAGTATGIAINSVSSQAANVPVIVRDDGGNQIASDTLNLAANGHLAFTLVTDKYAATANIRGTIEFDTPPGAQIGALGIRIPVAHTFTTLPALAK